MKLEYIFDLITILGNAFRNEHRKSAWRWNKVICGLGAVLFFIFGSNVNAGPYSWNGNWASLPSGVAGASGADATVPIYATVTASPPAITLNFPRPGAYQIFRKDPVVVGTDSASNWVSVAGPLPSATTTWTDTNVQVGQLYEYKAVMTNGPQEPYYPNPVTDQPSLLPGTAANPLQIPGFTSLTGTSVPSGYILSGISVDETQPRGHVILVVTTDVQANLPTDVTQLESDLSADGWFVHVVSCAPATSYDVAGQNSLKTVTVNAGGSGYTSGTQVGLSTTSGGQAVAVGTLTCVSGSITAVTVTYPGGGFSAGQSLYLTNTPNPNSVPVPGSGAVLSVGSITPGVTNPIVPILTQIKSIYNANSGQVMRVILLGKVPLCRSGAGDIPDPDGHNANNACYGADAYYASMTGTWTDSGSNYGSLGRDNITTSSTNLNLPGDGKFDQYYLSQTGGQADLGWGRIDLSNNIASQYQAIHSYLGKVHSYKTASASLQPGRRVAFRSSAYTGVCESFLTFALGITGNPANIDFIPDTNPPLPVLTASFDEDAGYTAEGNPYLFYLKGSTLPANGAGGEASFWTGEQSHWGFWYFLTTTSGENSMQQRLAESSYGLCWTWSTQGLRYFYHRMGMGLDTGDMMRVSINNTDPLNGVYAWVDTPNYTNWNGVGYNETSCSGGLFMNLMGDPTLRLFMFAPPTNLSVVGTSGQPVLSWTASTDPNVIGYHVYRTSLVSGALSGPATRLTSIPVTGTTYTDSDPTAGPGTGQWSYAVRAVRLETTGSGTFYNASLGAVQAVDMTNPPAPLQITTGGTLPAANWNTPYLQTLTAQGGTPPYSWTMLSGGTLLPGLTLASNGTLSGTTSASGGCSFTAKVTDVLGQTAQQAFTIAGQSNNIVSLAPEASGFLYSNQPTRVQGAVESMTLESIPMWEGLLRFNLTGLNTNNFFVSAKLRLYVCSAPANNNALIQAAMAVDSSWTAAWSPDNVCYSGTSITGTTINYEQLPADNTSVPIATSTTYPTSLGYVDIDVTQQVLTELKTYSQSNNRISFRLFTASQSQIAIGTGYSFANAIPQLIIQTTNAPNIVFNSPTVNPANLYVNSGLQINATVTAIPANAANLTTQWSQISGPGTATFSSPGTPSTSVTFSAPGTYSLQLSANDGVLQSTKTLTVNVLVPTGTVAAPAAGPANGLELRLPFDESSGTTANDYSGVTPPNSGTLAFVSGTANPAWQPSGGKIGGALLFSGNGQQVDVPDSSTNLLDGMSQMSISFWFYANSFPSSGSTFAGLVSKRKAGGGNESYAIAARGGGSPTTIWFDVAGSIMFSTVKPTSGAWYHIVMIFDGTQSTNNLQLYINGQPDTFGTVYSSGTTPRTTVPRNSGSNLAIGAYDTADTLGFNGLIDEVRIYNRVLTLPEIQTLASAAPTNLGPVITTNTSISGQVGTPMTLSASVVDNDPAGGALTYNWSQLNGPGTINIASPGSIATTGTPNQPGTYGLQFLANDGAITSFTDVAATVTGQTYSSWAATNNLTGNNALMTAVLEPDGYNNLFKYALGLSPTTIYNPGAAGLPTVQVNGSNHLTLSFDGVATDVSYKVQASSDLVNWLTIQTFSSGGAAPGNQTVQDTQAVGATPMRYMRLYMAIP